MKLTPDDDFVGVDGNSEPEKERKQQIIVSPMAADSSIPVWVYLAVGVAALWFLLTRKAGK